MVSKSEKKSVCVIIPAYNEGKGIKRCVDAVIRELFHIDCDNALIVVNDGSEDRTWEILKKLKNKYPKKLIVVTHRKNSGYGAALQSGVKEAIKKGFEFCIFMDSDLTNDPKYIRNFVNRASKNVDCVKASRYIRGGGMFGVPFYRRFVTQLGNIIARNLFRIGVRDCTNGFRMVRLSFLENIRFKENGFPIILEELYYLKKARARFTSIPVILTSRAKTASHFKYNRKMFWNYFKYALKAFFV